MNSKRTVLLAAIAAAALLALVSVSWAASAVKTTATASKSARAVVRVSAFKRTFHPTRKQRRQRRAIARIVKFAPRRAIASSADVSRARPSPISGGKGDVWIVPAENGSVCTFILDPVDGYGSSCATTEDIAEGAAVTMLGGGSAGPLADSAIVAVVVADNDEAPTVSTPEGELSEIDVHSNTAAALVPLGSVIESGDSTVKVPDLPKPKCEAVEPGESFQRCQL